MVELTSDGSFELDGYGETIETYDTADIQEFAKCWTGFDIRPQRRNYQEEGHARGNRIDPMRLLANGYDTKRDLFPKSKWG